MSTSSTNLCRNLAKALRAAKDDAEGPKITRESVADALDCSESQAGRWMADEYQDRIEQFQHALASDLGDVFASVLACGTPFVFIRKSATKDLDLDGDGRLDKDDVMAGVIELTQELGRKSELVHQHRDGRKYSEKQGEALQHRLNAARAWIDDLSALVNTLTEKSAGPRAAI